MKPEPNKDQPVTKEILDAANRAMKEWLRSANLQWSDVSNGAGGLSPSTIKRIRSAKGKELLADWLPDISKLFERLQKLASDLNKPSPGTWTEFFGPLIPQPRFASEPGMFNAADIHRRHLVKLADPLVEFILREAQSAKAARNTWKAGSLFNQACILLEMTGQWERAATYLLQLGELNQHTGDFHFHADALLRRGQALLKTKFFVEAAITFQDGLDVIEKHKDKSPPHRLKLRLLNYLAMALMDMGDATRALLILKNQSLELAKAHCSAAALASVQNRLAIVSLKLPDLRAAHGYILEALKTRLQLDMRSEAARSLVVLGRVHRRRGEVNQALFIWELALNWQSGLGDDEGGPHLLYRLGSTYCHLLTEGGSLSSKALSVALTPEHFQNQIELDLLKTIDKEVGPVRLEVQPRRFRLQAESALKRCIEAERNLGREEYSAEADKLIRSLGHQ